MLRMHAQIHASINFLGTPCQVCNATLGMEFDSAWIVTQPADCTSSRQRMV